MTRFLRAAAAALALAMSTPAWADDRLGQYVAYIGPHDIYNSKGARLHEPWQILRQDRANYHRFGLRDPGDEGDAFFASIDNRAAMERMLMDGYINPQAARAIVGGGVHVVMQIWGWGGQGRYVTVDVLR